MSSTMLSDDEIDGLVSDWKETGRVDGLIGLVETALRLQRERIVAALRAEAVQLEKANACASASAYADFAGRLEARGGGGGVRHLIYCLTCWWYGHVWGAWWRAVGLDHEWRECLRCRLEQWR